MCAQRTQISLGISPDWSESSQCAQWVAEDPMFLHADSEDFDQTERMPRLIWVFGGRTLILFVLSYRGSYLVSCGHECSAIVWSLKMWPRPFFHTFNVSVKKTLIVLSSRAMANSLWSGLNFTPKTSSSIFNVFTCSNVSCWLETKMAMAFYVCLSKTKAQ